MHFSVEKYIKYKTYCFLVSAGRPPLGQMPFMETPEGKFLAQSGAIMRYICKKAGNSSVNYLSVNNMTCAVL